MVLYFDERKRGAGAPDPLPGWGEGKTSGTEFDAENKLRHAA